MTKEYPNFGFKVPGFEEYGLDGPGLVVPLFKKSKEEPDTLEPTWWVMDQEPGMDDLAGTAGDILTKMKEDLKIFPFQDRGGNDRLFLARFELPKYGEEFQFSKAVTTRDSGGNDVPIDPKPLGFIHFLAGFPVDCCEMLVLIGEFSSKAKEGEDSKVTVKDGEGKAAAPVPEKFFKWPEEDKVMFNLTALPTKGVAKILAPNLEGEPEPANAHWWFQVDLVGDTAKFPVPGEFLGLGVRMMPDKPWGKQKSSPFIYSGNWMDTVYLTGGAIKAIIEPTDTVPYSTYTVTWRGKDIENVRPSDFALYKVGDRVTILKDVATEKKTQLWKDDDTKKIGDTWSIIPITFYGLEKET